MSVRFYHAAAQKETLNFRSTARRTQVLTAKYSAFANSTTSAPRPRTRSVRLKKRERVRVRVLHSASRRRPATRRYSERARLFWRGGITSRLRSKCVRERRTPHTSEGH